MDIDIDKISFEDKVCYLNEVVIDMKEIWDKNELFNHIKSSSTDLEDLIEMIYEIDDNYIITVDGLPIKDDDEIYIDRMFEDNLDDIIKETDIKQDYPELFEDVEVER